MTPSEYCNYWKERYDKAVKFLRRIGFPLEIIVSAAGVLSPVVIWMVAHG